jgi:hypothetical protein
MLDNASTMHGRHGIGCDGRATRVAAVLRTALVVGGLVAMGPTLAGSSLSVDVPTLNAVLPAAVPKQVDVELGTGTKLTVLLEELRVLGFDPAGGGDSQGHILTSLRVKIPQLGLEATLEPRLALRMVTASEPTIELRFAQAELRLPLGRLDIATLVPPMRYPAASVFHLEGIPMFGRVTGLTIGSKVLRVEFEIERRAVSG